MRRHPFDPIALVFGLTFAGAAILVLAGGSLTDDGDFLLPAGLFGLGIALLVQNTARRRPSRPADPAVPAGASDPAGPDHDAFHDALYHEAMRDLDAVDGTLTVRTPSGIEWPGPPTDAPDDVPDDGEPATSGSASPGEVSPGADEPTDRPGD